MMTMTSLPLLLASASPRRRHILARLGLPYTVGVAPGDEDAAQAHYQGPAEELAQWTAAHKALMMLSLPDSANQLVITADTTVILDGQILGKPRDAEHARTMLLALRGRQHRVVTGVVVSRLHDGQIHMRGASCSTPVVMRDYSETEIAAYIASGAPMDKAGAYGIQDTPFQPTASIDGCYYNVVGLPLCTLVELLSTFGIQPAPPDGMDAECPWSEQCHQ